jgi:hypothetical protein
MPLALLALHGYVETGNWRWLPLFAAAWLVQALSNGYYLLFFPVLLVLWLAWFVDWRRAPSRGVTLVATWVLASLPLVPVLIRYASVQRSLGLARTPEEMTFFSAKAGSFLNAPAMLAVWPSSAALTTEESLFPGLMPLLLVLGGTAAVAVRRRSTPDPADGADVRSRSPFVFYAAAAFVMWALAFGPAEAGSGLRGLLHPYTLLTFLPGFDGLRVPARFAMLATLCISVAAELIRLWPLRGSSSSMVCCDVAVGGLLLDG